MDNLFNKTYYCSIAFHSDRSGVLLSVVALQIGMPSQSNLSVLADRYKADSAYAAQTIFITTLISAITLPLLYLLCTKVFSII